MKEIREKHASARHKGVEGWARHSKGFETARIRDSRRFEIAGIRGRRGFQIAGRIQNRWGNEIARIRDSRVFEIWGGGERIRNSRDSR